MHYLSYELCIIESQTSFSYASEIKNIMLKVMYKTIGEI